MNKIKFTDSANPSIENKDAHLDLLAKSKEFHELATMQKNSWGLGAVLRTIRDEKMYKNLGASTFLEYIDNFFPRKKATAYAWISINEAFSDIYEETPKRIESINWEMLRHVAVSAKRYPHLKEDFLTLVEAAQNKHQIIHSVRAFKEEIKTNINAVPELVEVPEQKEEAKSSLQTDGYPCSEDVSGLVDSLESVVKMLINKDYEDARQELTSNGSDFYLALNDLKTAVKVKIKEE